MGKVEKTEYAGNFKFHPEDVARSVRELKKDCEEIQARIDLLLKTSQKAIWQY